MCAPLRSIIRTVRRLRPGQRVTVELDDDAVDHRVDCLVADVFASTASLTHDEALDPRLRDRLGSGAPGYLVFSHHGAEIGLHGVAVAPPSRVSVIDFVVVDGVQIRDRRGGRRVQFVTRARMFPTDTDAAGSQPQAIETFTLDLSEGGALLRYRPEFAEHRRYTIELFFAADPVPIRCEATYARQTDAGIGVRFGHLDAGDRARLAEVLTARRDTRLQRASATRTPPARPRETAPARPRETAPARAPRQRPAIQDMDDLESVLGELGVNFRGLFDAAPGGMAVMALDQRLIGVNPALCKMLGFQQQEPLERGLVDVSHPEDAQSTAVLLRSLAAGEIPRYTLDKRYIRKDGSVIWTRVSATLVSDEAGTPQLAFVQFEDAMKLRAPARRPRGWRRGGPGATRRPAGPGLRRAGLLAVFEGRADAGALVGEPSIGVRRSSLTAPGDGSRELPPRAAAAERASRALARGAAAAAARGGARRAAGPRAAVRRCSVQLEFRDSRLV